MATMNVPQVEVKYSNINIISLKNRTATIDVQTRKINSKGRYSKVETMEVKLSQSLVQWLWKKDANGKTSFQKYLDKNNITFHTGILKTMVFKSSNMSEDYNENPFKIIQYADGNTQLTLTCLRPKVKVGNSYKSTHLYYRKESYRRFVIQDYSGASRNL